MNHNHFSLNISVIGCTLNKNVDVLISFPQVISSDLSSLKCKLADMVAKIDEFKRRQVLMGHRVLQVSKMVSPAHTCKRTFISRSFRSTIGLKY